MTIREALERLDTLVPNSYTDREKIGWLSSLDSEIMTVLYSRYEEAAPPFGGYDDHTDRSTPLLAAAPFDTMYPYYLESRIHYHNGEFDRFNNASAMFQEIFGSFRSHYHRTHRPKGGAMRYF